MQRAASSAEPEPWVRPLDAVRGCDAVVLGCTELPLLVSEADSPLPALDSTRILARAALREATRGASARTREAGARKMQS